MAAPDQSPTRRRNVLVRAWLRWRAWRRSRPFWGGLLMIIGGVELALLPLGPLEIGVAGVALAGMPTYMLALFIIALGLIAWFTPNQKNITGLLGGICALGSLVLSNLGGLFIGALLVMLGAGAVFAWNPGQRAPRRRRRGRRRADPSSTPAPITPEPPQPDQPDEDGGSAPANRQAEAAPPASSP
ncbi:DUF6114 domain-containing protein [Lipingzhangella sp. LS1_29]|uniref:DUF6114 domain-containing protein n=1 Tax=Lipingzhangella rawalii TaxID=2055835 RepID=A0ABU2H4E9_9ACTN|nr:DUF6114 domain-containing protein [Lipingzhangella rawalii]MDS1269705.1 DUF6114 domain-containing protein [Lipingzhangella rawalii]